MPDEEFLNSFRKRYALLQEKLAQAQSKNEEHKEDEDYAPLSQAERLARARRNRLKMPELKDLRKELMSKAVDQGHLPASMGASGEWTKFLPKEDDPVAQVKVANAAEAAGLPTVAAAQLAQMAAKREQQRQQHMEQLSQLNQQAEQMKAAMHGTLPPGHGEGGSGMSGGLEMHVGRLRQLQEQQGQVAAEMHNLKGKDRPGPKGQGPGSPAKGKDGKGQRKGKAYGKWGPGKGHGDYHGSSENYNREDLPDYQNGQEQMADWYWGGWYQDQYQPWMQAPPQRGPRYGRRGMQPRGMGEPMSPAQSQGLQMQGMGDYRSPAEMQAINGMNAVLQRARGKMEVPVRATEQEGQPQTKVSAWGAAANEDAPAEAPVSGTGTGTGTGAGTAAVSTGAAQPAAEEPRRQSAASSATGHEGKEKKDKKDKKDKDKDTDSRRESKDKKKKDPKEDEDAVGKTGSRAQKSWFGK